MKVENWGFNYENETMEGYLIYALNMIKANSPNLALSKDQEEALFDALKWATEDLTAEEAYILWSKS